MVEHLIECNDHEMAQEIVLDSLKRQYDERLVLLIPRLKSGNPEQLEKRCVSRSNSMALHPC